MTFLKLKVQPGSKEDSLSVRAGDSYLVHVKAPAAAGRANAAALSLLAHHLGVPVGKLWIIKGAQSRAKIIEVRP